MIIGFIGVANMGQHIISRLSNYENNICVYDIDAKKTNSLKNKKTVLVCDTIHDVARNSDILFTCLPSVEVVKSVLIGNDGEPGACHYLKLNSLCVDLSSSNPLVTKTLSEDLKLKSIRFLDAPLSGGVRGAANGTLTVMVGGDTFDFEFVKPLLQLFGAKIVHVGKSGSGQAAKCLNNLCSATGLLIASECLNVAESFGIDPALFIDILNSSTGRNNSTENKMKQFILSKTFESGFDIALMQKDLISALDLASDKKVAMPLGAKCKEFWTEATDFLPGGSDHTEVIKWLNKS